MNTKAIIIGIAVLAVVGGGAIYAVNKNKDSDQSDKQSISENTSINGLLAQDKNLKCTYSYSDDEGNKSSGTTYIADQRMRGNFSVQTPGQDAKYSNTLRDGKYQYVWDESSNKGFKTMVDKAQYDDSDGSKDDSSISQHQAVDQDREYDFDCDKWNVDESVFEVPANVKFTDLTAKVQQTKQMSQDAKDKLEAACKNLSGQARDACEKAY